MDFTGKKELVDESQQMPAEETLEESNIMKEAPNKQTETISETEESMKTASDEKKQEEMAKREKSSDEYATNIKKLNEPCSSSPLAQSREQEVTHFKYDSSEFAERVLAFINPKDPKNITQEEWFKLLPFANKIIRDEVPPFAPLYGAYTFDTTAGSILKKQNQSQAKKLAPKDRDKEDDIAGASGSSTLHDKEDHIAGASGSSTIHEKNKDE